MKRIQISGGLYACLLFCQLVTTAVILLPAPLVNMAGQEAWLPVITGALLGLAPTMLGIHVCVRHPGLGPGQIARVVLGKWLGSLVSFLYAAFALFIFSMVMRDLYDFLSGVLLNRTPGLVMVAGMGAVVLYGIWAGLEPLARVAFQVVVALTAGVILLEVLCIREYSLLQREPFLYRGLGAILQGTPLPGSWLAEGVFSMSLVPHLKQPRQAYRWTLVAFAGAVLVLASIILNTVLVLGPDLPSRLVYPTFTLSELVNLGSAVERLEVLLVIIWTSGIFTMLGIYLLAAATATSHALGLKHHRVPAAVFAVVGVWLVRVWHSPLDLMEYGVSDLRLVIHFSLLFGIPLLLLAGSLVHGARQRRQSASA